MSVEDKEPEPDMPWLEEDDKDLPRHEYYLVMAVMAIICVIGTLILYRIVLPWLFNTHTNSGTIAAVLVLVLGWVPAYLVYFKVLRPLFREIYTDA
jgi:hypothetical protein